MSYDQHIASDPDISVWVSANAGTGKTKVLTDRVLRILLAGTPPDKILCITYTKAAAAEMEHRIEAQLGAWAIAQDDILHASLTQLTGKKPDEKTIRRARQLFALVIDAPERIRIQTIHSFCQSVLKRFPLEAGVAPHFSIIDEHTAAELLQEAQTRLFHESGDNGCSASIEALAGIVSESMFDTLLADIIANLDSFAHWLEKPDGAKTLIQRIYQLAGTTKDTTQETLYTAHYRYSPEELQQLRLACAALGESTASTDVKFYDGLSAWLEIPNAEKVEAYARLFLTRTLEPLKNLSTKSAEMHLPGLKDLLYREQERAIAYFGALQSLRMAQATGHVIALAHALLAIYRNLKDAHAYMDYNDLIARTVRLLERAGAAAWVLYKLDGGIDHLLVDEAQDTSPQQWKLVELLSGEFFSGDTARNVNRSLFVVGDSKQSIFSFQGADPHSFDAMQSRLRKRITASGSAFRNVQLALSFRSTAPVLQAVDEVFSTPQARNGLLFSEGDIRHEAHRTGMAGRVEIWPLTEPVQEEENSDSWQITSHSSPTRKPESLLAEQIATQIRQWLDERRQLLSRARPIEAGDIIILVQRRGTFTSAIMHALKQKDVDVAGADRLILTSHIAVEDCIALANFLLLPGDDMTLAIVLKSPFIDLTEEELFGLAYGRESMSLWERLKENEKFADAYAYLSDLLARVDYLPPYELFAYILETMGGRRELAARLGPEIHDPVNEFLSLAIRYSEMNPPSLQGFLHWVQSGETEIKRDMEKAQNEVRIMTVHGAKGLQAPIVFLPDTTRIPINKDILLWTPDDDSLPLWGPSDTYRDKHYEALTETLKLEREREYRRLLYVAMTRAEDELYICGWKGKRAIAEQCWYELVRRGISTQWQELDGKMILTSEQTVPPKTETAVPERTSLPALPDWINKIPAAESPTARPLTPSGTKSPQSVASPLQDQTARLRGILIHSLLQHLPDIAPDNRKETMERFITHYGSGFSEEMLNTVRSEVMAVMQHPDFTPVFSSDSVTEVPISGIAVGTKGEKIVISGQIDRLCVMGNDVYIIDYKTGIHVPDAQQDVPLSYIRQMSAYKQLVARIYPDKAVHCGLLWTSVPKMMLLVDL